MGVLKFQLTSPDSASRAPELRKALHHGARPDAEPSPGRASPRPDVLPPREQRERPTVRPLAGRGPRHADHRHGDPGRAARAVQPGRRAGAGQAQRGPQPARRLAADGPADARRARPGAGRGAAGVRQGGDLGRRPRGVVRRRAGEPGGRLAGGRPADGRLHRPGAPDPASAAAQAAHPASAACSTGEPKQSPWLVEMGGTFNTVQVGVPWKALAPTEGQYRWDEFDAQVAWCRQAQAPGPGRPAPRVPPATPCPTGSGSGRGTSRPSSAWSSDLVRNAVTRYRGKVPIWHLVHRPASSDCLGLSEEEQIRITARALQVARQADPAAQFTIGLERPWAEWMGQSAFQLGPLHLADYLVRADLGLAGLVPRDRPRLLPPRQPPPRPLRLFEAARPLCPAQPAAARRARLPLRRRPRPRGRLRPSGSSPRNGPARPRIRPRPTGRRKWVALAVAKPFVRSVTWIQPSDAVPHLYPHGGLFRGDNTAKPLVPWLKSFRRELLV